MRIGSLVIDHAEQRILVADGREAQLGSRARELLLALTGRPNQFITKAELLAIGWQGLNVDEANLSVQISGLRKFLAAHGAGTIEAAYGRGYRLLVGQNGTGTDDGAAGDGVGPGGDSGSTALRFGAQGIGGPAAAPPDGVVIGRDRELAQFVGEIGANALVTVCGLPGSGKSTFLHLAVATVGESFPGGIWWFGPADLAGEDAFAAALNARFATDDDSIDQFSRIAFQCSLPTLFVFDGIGNCPDWLRHQLNIFLGLGGTISVVAAAHTPLGLLGERLVPLGGLDLPAEGSDLKMVLNAPSSQLFCNTLAALEAPLPDSVQDLSLIDRICRRVDGMPGSIVAAARIAARIGIGGLYQSMTADRRGGGAGMDGDIAPFGTGEFAQSVASDLFDTLGDAELDLLECAAPFQGSFTLAQLAAVAGAAALSRGRTVAIADRLVSDGLMVAQAEDGRERFRLLEPIRTLARTSMERRGGRPRIDAAFLSLYAEDTGPVWHERRAASDADAAPFDRDADSRTAALAAALEGGRTLDALRILAAGRFGEGCATVRGIGSDWPRLPSDALDGPARYGLLNLPSGYWDLFMAQPAAAVLDSLLDAMRRAGDREGLVAGLIWSGWQPVSWSLYRSSDLFDRHLDEAEAMIAEGGLDHERPPLLFARAHRALPRSEVKAAIDLAAEAERQFLESGRLKSAWLARLGQVAAMRIWERYDEATRMAARMLGAETLPPAYRRLVNGHLGACLIGLNAHEEGQAAIRESMARFDPRSQAWMLYHFAGSLAATGDWSVAMGLVGFADVWTGSQFLVQEEELRAKILGLGTERLGQAAVARCLEDGRSWTTADVFHATGGRRMSA